MATKAATKDQPSADERALQAAGAALQDAEQRLTQAQAELNAAMPAGAGVAVVTLRVLTLRAKVEEAEADVDEARRRRREATAARDTHLFDALRVREAVHARELSELLVPVLAKAEAWQQDREQVARATGFPAGFSPVSGLLSPGVLDAVRRIAHPPTTVEAGPAPVPTGHVRIRALATLVDRDRLGHIVHRGDVYDFPEEAANDFIKRNVAEPVSA